MTTIRAKLAAIGLALATAAALAALSPAGPAVADMSPPCESPYSIYTIVYYGTTEEICLPPECFVVTQEFPTYLYYEVWCPTDSCSVVRVTCTVGSSQATLSDRRSGPYRRVDRQVIDTGQRAAPRSGAGQASADYIRIPVDGGST